VKPANGFLGEPDLLWRPDLGRFERRLRERLAEEGHPMPAAAAAVLVDRGRRGLDRATYATLRAVDAAALAAFEDGTGRL
jgi:hypothetical protein